MYISIDSNLQYLVKEEIVALLKAKSPKNYIVKLYNIVAEFICLAQKNVINVKVKIQ